VREILVSKIFRALDPDPVKKGRDSKEGGKGREVYDRELMGRKEREGTKRKVRKEGRKVLIPATNPGSATGHVTRSVG
jgi:hypothetical protein